MSVSEKMKELIIKICEEAEASDRSERKHVAQFFADNFADEDANDGMVYGSCAEMIDHVNEILPRIDDVAYAPSEEQVVAWKVAVMNGQTTRSLKDWIAHRDLDKQPF